MAILFFLLLLCLTVLSYGFIDPNLTLSSHPWFNAVKTPLYFMVYQKRYITTGIFIAILTALFFLYREIFIRADAYFPRLKSFVTFLIPFVLILIFSYPMLSYDLFNYMTTAKVAFTYRENPYVVMPIDISNDPYLAFTRAANKLALYGPTWLLLTWIPHTLGMGNIWQTIIAFKFVSVVFYLCFCYLIWRVTKSVKNVVFFALNPLVLIEVLVSGHNDIVMMFLACLGMILWQKSQWIYRCIGFVSLMSSFFVKGATVVFIPFLFFRKIPLDRLLYISSCLLFLVFITVAPLREELYPWYAVWFFSTAALLPYKKYSFLWSFLIALSIGLELRHVPYMAMGYYEGPGPVLRTVLTIIPVAVWEIWYIQKISNRKIRRHT